MCSHHTSETIKIRESSKRQYNSFLVPTAPPVILSGVCELNSNNSRRNYNQSERSSVTCFVLAQRDFFIDSRSDSLFEVEDFRPIVDQSPGLKRDSFTLNPWFHCAKIGVPKNWRDDNKKPAKKSRQVILLSISNQARLIQQLDNHYHRNCITGIISKNWYIIWLLNADGKI